MTRAPFATLALLVTTLASAAACAATNGDDLRRYGAVAPITLTSAEGLQRIELPLPVLQASRSAGYADVRIFDTRGEPVPIAWAEPAPPEPPVLRTVTVSRFEWPVAASPKAAASGPAAARIEVNAAGTVLRIEVAGRRAAPQRDPPQVWLLDLSGTPTDGDTLRQIALDWPHHDDGLSAVVRVEGSDDTQQWTPIAQARLLELPGNDPAAPQQKRIDWPAGQHVPKYLRLQFDVPMALERSELVLARPKSSLPLAGQRVSFLAQDASPGEPPVWELDLLGRVPVARITIHPAQDNTVSSLRLDERDDPRQPWRTVTSFIAWRLVRDGKEQTSAPVSVQAPPARYWRLVADPRTSRPADSVLDAAIEWTAPQLVFAAGDAAQATGSGTRSGAQDGAGSSQSGTLTLAVGRENAGPVALPLASLMPGHVAGAEAALPLAQLGELAAKPVTTPGLPQRISEASPADRQRWILWGVLSLAVALLAGLALKLARDIRSR